jgi:hypothetical protein
MNAAVIGGILTGSLATMIFAILVSLLNHRGL